jgi:SAM-dependent methyltransferase
MKLYKELAEYYYEIEKVGRKFEDEIDFLRKLFGKYSIKSIVDLGCGSGEHVFALYQKGFEICGIDISDSMIDIAKKRYPDCNFQLADLQSYKIEKLVDAIMCMFGTFNYIIKDEDIINSLKNIRDNIHPKGILVLEIWNSSPVKKIKRKAIAPVSLSKVGNVMIKRNRGFRVANNSDGVDNLVEVNFIFNLNQEIVKDRHLMRVFSFSEIENLLSLSGFNVVHNYSNVKMEVFQESAGRMILICKRKQ